MRKDKGVVLVKFFVVADVHGFYDELKKALDEAGFDKDNENHFFVSLGDLLDRGPKPRECMEFVMSLPEDRRILICGNHEVLMEEALCGHRLMSHDYHNGTAQTIFDVTGITEKDAALRAMFNDPLYNSYIQEVIDYAETKTAIFVHGWIPCGRHTKMSYYGDHKWIYDPFEGRDWRDATAAEWDAARWWNGMAAWADGVREKGKTIFCGHWHTAWGHTHIHHVGNELDKNNYGPFVDDGIVALDGCTAYTKRVNVYTFEE